MGITDLPFGRFVDAVRKANQQLEKGLLKEAEAAASAEPQPPAPAAEPPAETDPAASGEQPAAAQQE
ncbi:hypothetical protein D3C78_1777430 [compost metagenome]